MSHLIASINRFIFPPGMALAAPAQLFERAGTRAGRNPRQAHELRQAAAAWLRVVR
jgi:hypothetical protein